MGTGQPEGTKRSTGEERPETSREWLRRAVRVAAVQAQDPDGFRRKLAEFGVAHQPRLSDAGELLSYSVAAPGVGDT